MHQPLPPCSGPESPVTPSGLCPRLPVHDLDLQLTMQFEHPTCIFVAHDVGS
jgi:hypothetical protein